MIKKILVAIDGSEHSQKAIKIACDLTMKYGASLDIIHVIEDYDIPQSVKDFMKGEEIHETPEYLYLTLIGNKIAERAEAEVHGLGVDNVKTVILQGKAAAKIIEYAKQSGIDIIVMGNHGTQGVEDLIMGSVPRKVCHLAECTCMTVK